MATAIAPPELPETEARPETAPLISKGARTRPLFDPEIIRRATKDSFIKLDPWTVAKNPVMFVVEVGAALTTLFVIKDALPALAIFSSGFKSPCGCGSRWYSPILPRRWRK